jgi:hypothetical protein
MGRWYGKEGAKKAAKRIQDLLENPTMEMAAKVFQTAGRQASIELYRELNATYGEGKAKEIMASIRTLADQYDPNEHPLIDEEE